MELRTLTVEGPRFFISISFLSAVTLRIPMRASWYIFNADSLKALLSAYNNPRALLRNVNVVAFQ